MLPLALAGLLLDPHALSKLLQLPLKERTEERVKTQTRLPLKLHGTLLGDDYALALVSDPVRTLAVGSVVRDKLHGIVPGSIYEKLGIQNGDILRKVNGGPVDFSTARLVQPGQQLTVELERAGASYVLSGQLD